MKLHNGPEVVIVGAGAMACALAGKLTHVTNLCMLDDWSTGVDRIAEFGIQMQDGEKTLQTDPILASANPVDCSEPRYALVLVKSWQTKAAAEMLAACLHTEGIAVTLQNGLGNDDVLAEELGRERVFQGVTSIGAALQAPGHVQVAGWGAVYLPSHAHVDSLADIMEKAGLQVVREESVDVLQWRKLVVNSVVNPLTALLNVPNGALLSMPGMEDLMRRIAEETVHIAEARGVLLDMKDPYSTVCDVIKTTAANRSSMLQDIERGAPTEIDVINAAVARLARSHELDAPYNQTLAVLVRALAARTAGV